MSEKIVPQEETKVKCEVEWCDEDAWRDGLCWFHFCEERIAEWDAQDAERQTSEQSIGYIFGDPIDTSWWGYAPQEVLAT